MDLSSPKKLLEGFSECSPRGCAAPAASPTQLALSAVSTAAAELPEPPLAFPGLCCPLSEIIKIALWFPSPLVHAEGVT